MMQPYYDHNGITIYHSRCEDVLGGLSGAALLLTDPCYGTTQLEWDIPVDLPTFWPLAYRACLPTGLQVLFSAQPFTTDLINSNRKRWRYEIIWHKTMATGFLDANRRPLRAHENIQVFAEKFGSSTYNPQKVPCRPRKEHKRRKGTPSQHYSHETERHLGEVYTGFHPHDVVSISNGHGGSSDHETRKPLDLMMWLVASFSNPGDLVIDSFCGSGSTLEACKLLGRRAIGIDIRESCCETSARGLSQEVMELV
jgi:site-specific DNA-methyltransferase (adenine-specific)